MDDRNRSTTIAADLDQADRAIAARDPVAIAAACDAVAYGMALRRIDPESLGPELRARERATQAALIATAADMRGRDERRRVLDAVERLGGATVDAVVGDADARSDAVEEAYVRARLMLGAAAVIAWPPTHRRRDALAHLASLRAEGLVVREGGFPSPRRPVWRFATRRSR